MRKEVDSMEAWKKVIQFQIIDFESKLQKYCSDIIMDSEGLKSYCTEYVQNYLGTYQDEVKQEQLNLAKQVSAITESLLIE